MIQLNRILLYTPALANPIAGIAIARLGGSENATRVFPPTEIKQGPVISPHSNRRPAPDPVGEKCPPVAGRALAGGFVPPAVRHHFPDLAKAIALAN